MGSEVSKPVEAPTTNDANEFQMISPVSDISNPSEFRKRHVPLQGGHTGVHDRRRTSRVVTKALSKPVREVPAPSALYFPTRETEKYHEQIAASRSITDTNKKPQRTFFKNGRKAKDKARHTRNKEKRGGHRFRKGASNQVETGAKESEPTRPTAPSYTNGRENLAPIHGKELSQAKAKTAKAKKKGNMKQIEVSKLSSGNNEIGVTNSASNDSQRYGRNIGMKNDRVLKARKETKAKQVTQSHDTRTPAEDNNGTFNPSILFLKPASHGQHLSNCMPPSESLNPALAKIGLHHADTYFDRLGCDFPGASPYVQNDIGASAATSSRLGLTLTSDPSVMESPINKLFHMDSTLQAPSREEFDPILEENSVATVGSARRDKAKVATSLTKPEHATGHAGVAPPLGSPVNGLIQLQVKGGQTKSISREDSSTEQKSVELFIDEATEDSIHHGEPIKHSPFIKMDEEKRNGDSQQGETASPPSVAASKVSTVTMGTFASAPSRVCHDDKGQTVANRVVVADGSNKECVTGVEIAIEKPDSPSGREIVASDDDDTYFKPQEQPNAKSAFRARPSLPEEPIKQIASLGPKSRTSDSKQTSKLEKLFRPILPALSDGDARSSTSSYDPFEIHLTESAPSVIESDNYHAIALTSQFGSPNLAQGNRSHLDHARSPSMMSIDSQVIGTPLSVRPTVSDQAKFNAEFLFFADYAKPLLLQDNSKSERDSTMFSISTIGARSRLSQRSTRLNAVTIPISGAESVVSSQSSRGPRRVRFSTDRNPAEKLATITAAEPPILQTSAAEDIVGPKNEHVQQRSMVDNIVVPEIERKVSDLTDNLSDFDTRCSVESSRAGHREDAIPEEDFYESVCQEHEGRTLSPRSDDVDEAVDCQSPETKVHWSYREEGNLSAVTPHFTRGKPVSNVANSPYLRFRAAKTKFATVGGKDSPKKKSSPRKIKTRTGGIVSTRINELNRRVSEVRKLRRKRHSSSGPSRQNESISMIRTPLIMNYNPNSIGAGRFTLPHDEGSVHSHESDHLTQTTQETLSMSKMYQDTQRGSSSAFDAAPEVNENAMASDDGKHEPTVEGDADLRSRLSMGSSSSIFTVRHERKNFDPHTQFTRRSIESYSTSSSTLSGLSSIRKQVFRQEVGGIANKPRVSLVSSDDASTTLSSILDKENATYLPFKTGTTLVKPTEQNHPTGPQSLHLSPTQRTPAQARKWRSLAAAAQEKDSSRRALGKGKRSAGKPKRGLSERHANQITYAV